MATAGQPAWPLSVCAPVRGGGEGDGEYIHQLMIHMVAGWWCWAGGVGTRSRCAVSRLGVVAGVGEESRGRFLCEARRLRETAGMESGLGSGRWRWLMQETVVFLEKLAGWRWLLPAGRNWPARRIGHRLHRTCAKADLSGRRRCLKHEASTHTQSQNQTHTRERAHSHESTHTQPVPCPVSPTTTRLRVCPTARLAAFVRKWGPTKAALGGWQPGATWGGLTWGGFHLVPQFVTHCSPPTPLNFLNSSHPLFSTKHQERPGYGGRTRDHTPHNTNQSISGLGQNMYCEFLHLALSRSPTPPCSRGLVSKLEIKLSR